MGRPIVTLMTDFGTTDTYVGQMRGAMLAIHPDLQIVDLTHAIEPQNILQAAVLLSDAVDAFPEGTIHVVVVDPGVGSSRRKLALELGPHRFVGPDNGVFTAVMNRLPLKSAVILDRPEYWRKLVSSTFHGRDIFGPVAAWWSLGTDLTALGTPSWAPLTKIEIPEVTRTLDGLEGLILSSDRFGNLMTNITLSDLDAFVSKVEQSTTIADLKVTVDGRIILNFHTTYAEVPWGDLIALIGSSGRLEIAINGGNARESLGNQAGASVIVKVSQSEAKSPFASEGDA